jgi:hypothetical protein
VTELVTWSSKSSLEATLTWGPQWLSQSSGTCHLVISNMGSVG